MQGRRTGRGYENIHTQYFGGLLFKNFHTKNAWGKDRFVTIALLSWPPTRGIWSLSYFFDFCAPHLWFLFHPNCIFSPHRMRWQNAPTGRRVRESAHGFLRSVQELRRVGQSAVRISSSIRYFIPQLIDRVFLLFFRLHSLKTFTKPVSESHIFLEWRTPFFSPISVVFRQMDSGVET